MKIIWCRRERLTLESEDKAAAMERRSLEKRDKLERVTRAKSESEMRDLIDCKALYQDSLDRVANSDAQHKFDLLLKQQRLRERHES